MPLDDAEETLDDGEIFDCENCGACCRCYPIFALDSDADREPLIKEKGVFCENFLGKGLVAYRLYPLARTKGCAFLGDDQLCSIYSTRPAACRTFKAGDYQCIEARRRKGIGRDAANA